MDADYLPLPSPHRDLITKTLTYGQLMSAWGPCSLGFWGVLIFLFSYKEGAGRL